MPINTVPLEQFAAENGLAPTTCKLGEEFGENGENARYPVIDWLSNSPNSSNSSGSYTQAAVYPEDSILKPYFQYARANEEAADCYIIGAILPVCAAALGRRVFLRWEPGKKYPNIWTMLAGKPGDRKSSIIRLVERIATALLPIEAFIPKSFSAETLFDEFHEESGGRPDKLWLVSDANPILKDWEKTQNGERIAARFLDLYDCCSLSESFRRNKTNQDGKTRRKIPETSTSLCFGSTFNICRFQGQELRSGLARRFLYYVATGHGNFVSRPQDSNLGRIIDLFKPLLAYAGEIDFDADAKTLWESFQSDNRRDMGKTLSTDESALSRLNSAPMQTLSVAILFEACRAAADGRKGLSILTRDSLHLAIRHMARCLEAAEKLESIADQVSIAQDAEIFLEKIRHGFTEHRYNGSIYLTKTNLTARFCHNRRPNSPTPDDLYLKWIPSLIRNNQARLALKEGKKEVYAFRLYD